MDNALFPYAGTSGHSGGDTSRERAERNDSLGLTSERQARVMSQISRSEEHGRTCAELEFALWLGHGSISGALSVLHQAGRLVRLTERRSRQFVYVLPKWQADRELSPYRPNPARAELARVREGLEIALAHLENDPDVLQGHASARRVLRRLR